jgi:hypothetical protein
MSDQPPQEVVVRRAQLEALMRVLVDEGHMTPVATRQIRKVLDEGAPIPEPPA